MTSKTAKIFWVTLDAGYYIVTCKFPITSLQCHDVLTTFILLTKKYIADALFLNGSWASFYTGGYAEHCIVRHTLQAVCQNDANDDHQIFTVWQLKDSRYWTSKILGHDIENALWGEKLGQNRGRGHRILTPNKNFLTRRAPNLCAKFHHGPICRKLSGKVITFWVSSGKRVICLLSPAIAQRTGVSKSVAFARWQQGAGFVVPLHHSSATYSVKVDV